MKDLQGYEGAQKSSLCSPTHDSGSKPWWILTYLKCDDSSLDIWQTTCFDTLAILFWRNVLLVGEIVWFLSSNRYLREIWIFLLSFEENCYWSASRAPESLRRCYSKRYNVWWFAPSLQEVISTVTIVFLVQDLCQRQETLSMVFLSLNNCSSGKKKGISSSHRDRCLRQHV